MGSHGWPPTEAQDGQQSYQDNTAHWTTAHPGARPISTISQRTNHQRTMTERIERPPQIPPRLRSHTSTGNDLNGLGRPSLSVETDSRAFDRRPASMSLHARGERSSSLTKQLKTKASRFLRRQASHGNLTSLQTIDWSEELDDSPYEAPSSSTSPKLTKRRIQNFSRPQGTSIRRCPFLQLT